MLMENYDPDDDNYVADMMALAKECVDNTNQFNGCIVARPFNNDTATLEGIFIYDTVSEAVQCCWCTGAEVCVKRDDLVVNFPSRYSILYGIKEDTSTKEIVKLVNEYKKAKQMASRENQYLKQVARLEQQILSHAAHLGKFFEGRL